ncbi:MAG TPA: insulinase family protein [Planctomycetaceae bacterium]|nr:insulinase family protein [Planctomycetaceae bacterium]
MELLTHKTDGAPEIIILRDPTALTTSIGWFVRAGSRDESGPLAGVSHFLEHMVFKGTARRTAEDVNRELDHLGAQSNAFTSEESTVFYASVLPECQQRCLDLLTDLMQPSLDQHEFETEKQVILEEIAMYDDQPPYGAFEAALEHLFGPHPLATRVLGTTESISDMVVDQMRSYHRQRYSTENMFLVASGNVDPDPLIELVTNQTARWPHQTATRKLSPPKFQSGQLAIRRDATQQHYGIRAWPGMDCNAPQRYALRFLCSIVGDDSGRRLFWELIDSGRAETATLWPHFFDECGCVLGYLCCAHEDVHEIEAILGRVLQQILQEGVTERELELARNKICASLILSDERPSSRLFALGQSWLSRRSYEPLDVVLSRYAAVTRDEILQVAQQTLSRPTTYVQVVDSQNSD